MKKILIGYPLDKHKQLQSLAIALKKRFSVVFKDYDMKWLRKNIHLFHTLVPSLKVSIDEGMIKKARLLKLMFTPTTGIDHLKFNIRKSGIKVLSLADFPKETKDIASTAELAFSFILSLSRKVFLAREDVLRMDRWQRNDFIGSELKGKTLGVLGLGRVGRRIAQYAQAFGMRIIYWDIDKKTLPYERKKSIAELFRESDFVICALALRPGTRYLINKKNVRYFKTGSFFINISRGKIVEENALCWALDKGILAGAAADVLEEELTDFKKSPLYRYARKHPKKNTLITPHIGGATIEAWKKVFPLVFNKILHFKG